MKQNREHFTILITVMVMIVFGCDHSQEIKEPDETTAAGAAANQQPNKPDKSVFAGNWVRTDAEYRIIISDLTDDGKMKAEYLNPKSIHVAESRWTNDAGILRIFIELRDTNYPGSKYNLAYVPGKDMLAGEYFQAVEQTTYQVQFVRVK